MCETGARLIPEHAAAVPGLERAHLPTASTVSLDPVSAVLNWVWNYDGGLCPGCVTQWYLLMNAPHDGTSYDGCQSGNNKVYSVAVTMSKAPLYGCNLIEDSFSWNYYCGSGGLDAWNTNIVGAVWVPCPAGQYHAASTGCTACPQGTYSAAPGASACTPCPSGKR